MVPRSLTLTECRRWISQLEADPEHAQLYAQQVPYFADAWTEIHEVLEL